MKPMAGGAPAASQKAKEEKKEKQEEEIPEVALSLILPLPLFLPLLNRKNGISLKFYFPKMTNLYLNNIQRSGCWGL